MKKRNLEALCESIRRWLFDNNQRYFIESGKQISKIQYRKTYPDWVEIDRRFIALYEFKHDRFIMLVNKLAKQC